MSDIVINKHNFETAKEEIGRFSESVPNNVSLKKVEEDGGLFNWGNHKVTGEEFNSRLKAIQSLMIGQNKNIKTVISKFGEIFKALDALDDDYISAILTAVNAAKKASMEAKDAQVDINRTIEALKQTVEKLKSFKSEVTRELSHLKSFQGLFGEQPLQHAKDIDSIWIDVQNHSEGLQSVQESHEALARSVSANVDALGGNIQQLLAFKTVLEGYQHLPQVDETWALAGHTSEEVGQIKNRFDNHIKEISATFSEVDKSLKSLQEYRSALEGLTHLHDVDSIWKDVRNHSEGLQSVQESHEALARSVSANVDALGGSIQQLLAFKTVLEGYQHLRQIDEIWNSAQHLKERADGCDNHLASLDKQTLDISLRMDQEQLNNSCERDSLSKRIRRNHIISSCTLLAILVFGFLYFLHVL